MLRVVRCQTGDIRWMARASGLPPASSVDARSDMAHPPDPPACRGTGGVRLACPPGRGCWARPPPGCAPPQRRASWRRLGLFKVLILCSQGSERQHGLRNHRPVRIGNRPIVQLTQARDGAVPHTANPMPDHPPVHAGCIIRDITHPPDPFSWAFMGRFFILPLPDAVAARMEAP